MIKNTIISFILVLWLSTLNGWKVAGLEKIFICGLLIVLLTIVFSYTDVCIKSLKKYIKAV